MSKRFTATEKWQDPWFCSLTDNEKLFWLFLLDNCDNAGVWQVNWFLFSAYVKNFKFNPDKFKKRVIFLSEDKWFIPKFIEFQYGELREDCKPHLSVIRTLKRHNLWPIQRVSKGYPKGIDTLEEKEKEKEQEKDQEKDKEKDKEKEKKKRFKKPTVQEIEMYCKERNNSIDAQKFYDYYESNGWRIGGKAPMKDWKATIRTWEHNQRERGGARETREVREKGLPVVGQDKNLDAYLKKIEQEEEAYRAKYKGLSEEEIEKKRIEDAERNKQTILKYMEVLNEQ